MDFFHRYKRRFLLLIAVIGPGLITAFADNDAGGIATYSVAASRFGYAMLTIMIPITIVLAVTQEIGARMAVVTGKGLGDLIRERFGIKISIFVFLVVFVVNFGVVLQDTSGLKSALGLFGLNEMLFTPFLLFLLFIFIVKSNFSKIEKFFLFLIFFYLTYLCSAILAQPDWGQAMKSVVTPPRELSIEYLVTSVAVLGTTVTIWGQFFINSYVKDKKLPVSKLKYEQLEIYVSSILSNVSTWFIMLAVIATVYVNNIPIQGAAEAALAIEPFAGSLARSLFGVGLLVAGLLGCAIVPLSTAYAFAEFFGYEGSLDSNFKKSRLFYGFFIFQIVIALIIVLQPGFSLFQFTLYADFLNGLALPVIFFFLYRLANDNDLMGKYKNSKTQNILLVGSGVVITIAAIVGLVGRILNLA